MSEVSQVTMRRPGSWNLSNRGRPLGRRPRRRMTRIERVDGSIMAWEAEARLQLRALVNAQARVVEAKARLSRLQAIRQRLAGEAAHAEA